MSLFVLLFGLDASGNVVRGPLSHILMIRALQHVKPITSAILSSDHSLNPTPPTPEAPTTITVPVPPPTSESRQAIVASVGKSAEVANNAIRNARQSHHKRLRALQLERKIRPDDLRKANAAMEKTVEKGVAEVKKVADRARKTLESQ